MNILNENRTGMVIEATQVAKVAKVFFVLLASPLAIALALGCTMLAGPAVTALGRSVEKEDLANYVVYYGSITWAAVLFVWIGCLVAGKRRRVWGARLSYWEGVGFALYFAFWENQGEGPLWIEFLVACISGAIVTGFMKRSVENSQTA